jgi:hypothetical protein
VYIDAGQLVRISHPFEDGRYLIILRQVTDILYGLVDLEAANLTVADANA